MTNDLVYTVPNCCAWCGSPDPVGKRMINAIKKVESTAAGITTNSIGFNLPICNNCRSKQDRNNAIRIGMIIGSGILPFLLFFLSGKSFSDSISLGGIAGCFSWVIGWWLGKKYFGEQEILIPHGNYVEFLNKEFHRKFSETNLHMVITFLPEELNFPNECAWCGAEPAIQSKPGIVKSKILVPIGKKCLSSYSKTNFVGWIIRGRLIFFNAYFHEKFSQLNPIAAYDVKQAIMDDKFDSDIKDDDGDSAAIIHTLNPRMTNKFFRDSFLITDSLFPLLINDDEKARKIIDNWLLACGLDDYFIVSLENMIFRPEDDKNVLMGHRLMRLNRRIDYLFYLYLFEKGVELGKANEIVQNSDFMGLENHAFKRIVCRTDGFSKQLTGTEIPELKKTIIEVKKRQSEALKVQQNSKATWNHLLEQVPNSRANLATYLTNSWVSLDSKIILEIVDTVFASNIIQVFEIISMFVQGTKKSKDVSENEAFRIYTDLRSLEMQISLLKTMPEILSVNYEYLLKN